MFDAEVFKTMIKERSSYDPNDDFAVEALWERMVVLVSSDLEGAIHYIRNYITNEELYWFSEAFDQIVEKTQSLEFLEAVLDAAGRISDFDERNNILMDVSYATGYFINDDDDTIRNHIFKLQKDRFDYYCEVRRPEFIINEKKEP